MQGTLTKGLGGKIDKSNSVAFLKRHLQGWKNLISNLKEQGVDLERLDTYIYLPARLNMCQRALNKAQRIRSRTFHNDFFKWLETREKSYQSLIDNPPEPVPVVWAKKKADASARVIEISHLMLWIYGV